MLRGHGNAVLPLALTMSFLLCLYLLAFVGHDTLSTHLSTMFLAPTAYYAAVSTHNADTQSLIAANQPSDLHSSSTHVTVSSLCPRPLHVAANYTGHEEDWLRMPLPTGAYERDETQLIVWDVDIDLQTGEFKMPLIVEWMGQYRKYVYHFAQPITMNWIRQQIAAGKATCTTTYTDGSRSHIEARILHAQPESETNPPYLTCSLAPFKVPVSIDVKISEADGTQLTLPICTQQLPRFYAIIQLKSYFSWTISEVVDFLNYHYLTGWDHVVLHYRWALTQADREALQPYIDGQFLTVHNWPQRNGPTNEVEPYADQDMLILISQMKTRKQTQWILAPDMDEYLYINSWAHSPPSRRQCNNSLHCMSPIREFLDLHREYAIVSYWTSNMVPYEPPADKQQEADRYRYEPANSHLPWAVRRIYKRAWHDHRAPVIAKWMFQPAYTTQFLTHGGSGVRPTWGDGEDVTMHAVHFHRYDHPNPAEFWEKEAVRDSTVSDILEAELWPQGTSQVMLDGIARFKEVRKQRGG